MPITRTALLAGLLAVTPAHVSVQTPKTEAPSPSSPPSSFLVDSAPAKDPFAHIFVKPLVRSGEVQPDVRPVDAQPRVVCGLTLVPARPELDPKIAPQQEPQPNREYKIRTILPRVCRQ